MIFLDLLQTFRNFTFEVLPLFIIALAISAVAAQQFPPHSLDQLIQRHGSRTVLMATLFGVLLPATPGYRIPMAALARRSGAPWTPVLVFVGAGAAAGVSTAVVTLLIGWQFALLRLVVAALFAFLLSLVLTRVESRLGAVAMDCEVEPLFHRDFCEATLADVDPDEVRPGISGVWVTFVRLARIVAPWLGLSLFLATLIKVVVPAGSVAALLRGPLLAPKAALLGLPFYFVLGADVPLVLVLLQKGMGLSGAVALMLAAPVVNLPVFSIIGRWVGYRRALAFLALCWMVASAIGIAFGYFGSR